ncbi:hypothetical protein T484DRAFT_1823228 [Baffinella frigidus]|nr:hypothetical protein T484DRAFT_1823228 [Cryptophyta sp. CCMP2293]
MAKAVATLFFPTGGFAAFTMSLPELFNCANYFSDMNGNKICTPWTPDRPYGRTHHFALKQLKMGTWNRDFVQTLEENKQFQVTFEEIKQFQLDEIKKRETSCESSKYNP